MGVFSGPNVITTNLSLNLTTSNRKTLLDSAGSQGSLINTDSWTVGTGGVTGYPVNGDTTENQRLIDTDPWGNQNIVWGTYPSGNGQGDGGWNSDWVSADKSKTYRFSVWVRRTSSTASGNFYFGLYTNGTGNTYHLSDGASQTNPYWEYNGLGYSIFVQNRWILYVGHLFPYNYTGTTAHPQSGFYFAGDTTKQGLNAGNVPNDVKFPSDATAVLSRVYHFYCGDNTSRLQFSNPRIDLVDGNEPSISELINKNPKNLYDQSGNSRNLVGVNNPTPSRTNGGILIYDGSNDYSATVSNPLINWAEGGSFEIVFQSADLTSRAQGILSITNGTQFLNFYCGGNSKIRWEVIKNAGITYTGGFVNNTTLSNNTWYHVIGTWTSSGVSTIYLNGVIDSSQVQITGTNWPSEQTSSSIIIGEYAGYFNGKIALSRVYNKPLTALQVKQNFDSLRDKFGL